MINDVKDNDETKHELIPIIIDSISFFLSHAGIPVSDGGFLDGYVLILD